MELQPWEILESMAAGAHCRVCRSQGRESARLLNVCLLRFADWDGNPSGGWEFSVPVKRRQKWVYGDAQGAFDPPRPWRPVVAVDPVTGSQRKITNRNAVPHSRALESCGGVVTCRQCNRRIKVDRSSVIELVERAHSKRKTRIYI